MIRPMNAARVVLVVAAALALTACAPHQGPATAAASPVPAITVPTPVNPVPAAGVTCKLGSRNGQPMPDPACTPGATNPEVTQANIGATICKTGWTRTVRPATSVTNKIKTQAAVSYGLAAGTQGELDHLISLELGGAPSDPRNLWLEPGPIPNPKDAVENKLNSAVCSGLITLAAAQKAIAASWTTAIDDVRDPLTS